MREREERRRETTAGSLLLAHPAMRDGNFRRAVVLMTLHNEDGAMGVVLNRPLGRRAAEMDGSFALGPLGSVPLFQGGPVQTEQLIFAGWKPNGQGFQLHFGVDPEKAANLAGDPSGHVRGFLGYAGWSGGQLEGELKQNTWVVAAAPPDLFEQPSDESLWRILLSREGPEWRLLADEPERPEAN